MRQIHPDDAVRGIIEAVERLDTAIEESMKWARKYGEAEHAYRLGKAKAYLEIRGGTIPERKARALVGLADEHREATIAGAMWEASKEAQRSRRAELSAAQSINNSAREDWYATKSDPRA